MFRHSPGGQITQLLGQIQYRGSLELIGKCRWNGHSSFKQLLTFESRAGEVFPKRFIFPVSFPTLAFLAAVLIHQLPPSSVTSIDPNSWKRWASHISNWLINCIASISEF